MSLITVGIDPGIANVGYGVIKSDNLSVTHHVQHGMIKTKAKEPLPSRLAEIYRDCTFLFLDHEPQIIAIEEFRLQPGKMNNNVVKMPMAIGAIMAAVGNYQQVSGFNIEFMTINPTTVKSSIGGHGKSTKEVMQHAVKDMLNMDDIPTPDHAADALALALYAERAYGIMCL